MSARSRKHVKILGHRFKRESFFAAVVAFAIFVTVIVVAWIVLLLVLDRRQQKTMADSLAKERAQAQAAAQQPATPIVVEEQPSALELFCEEQQTRSGFPVAGPIKMSGVDTQSKEKLPFIFWWSPKGVRLRYVPEEGASTDLVTDGVHCWQITAAGPKRIDGEPDGMFVNQLWRLFDPLSNYGRRGFAYRMLFDERFRNQDCRVIGLREQGKREVRFFFNVDTLDEIRRLVWLVGQQEGQREILMDNYRDVGGTRLPSQISILSGKDLLHGMAIDSVEILPEEPTGLFHPKAFN